MPEKNQITVCLMVTLKHFDRSMTVYGQEIEIEELKVQIGRASCRERV